MDFFFWVVAKNVQKNPKTVNESKDYIYDAYGEIDENQNYCHSRTVYQSVVDRCEECCNAGTGHFEHIRD